MVDGKSNGLEGSQANTGGSSKWEMAVAAAVMVSSSREEGILIPASQQLVRRLTTKLNVTMPFAGSSHTSPGVSVVAGHARQSGCHAASTPERSH